MPGTAARILDDDIRARLTGGTDIPAARWIELITTAHEVGLRSTATMVYGHVETPADQVAHLRTLAGDPGPHRRVHRDDRHADPAGSPASWGIS